METELLRLSTQHNYNSVDNESDTVAADNNTDAGTTEKNTDFGAADKNTKRGSSCFARSQRVCCIPDFEVERLLLLMDAFLGMSVCVPSVS